MNRVQGIKKALYLKFSDLVFIHLLHYDALSPWLLIHSPHHSNHFLNAYLVVNTYETILADIFLKSILFLNTISNFLKNYQIVFDSIFQLCREIRHHLCQFSKLCD